MKNRDFYKETMEQIVLSEETFRAVRNVEVNSKKKKSILKYVAVVASVAVALFISSNALVYAMTGETLMEMVPDVIEQIKNAGKLKPTDVVVGGNAGQSKEDIISTEEPQVGVPRVVDFYIDENGLHTYVIDLDGHIQKAAIRVDGVLEHSSVIVYSTYGRAGIICFEGSLSEKDDRILLCLADEIFDITEDFKDGVATGSWHETSGWFRGMTFEYTVTGTLEEYTVAVRLVVPE
ncbi:MAG: hypothetical protein E7283_05035 [Lachnospiraceae bacterium]|nr:hypothetical protein [Lachnospiraceae bacterium]